MPETPVPSMLPTYLLLLVFGALAVVALAWSRKRGARQMQQAAQSLCDFLQESGFRVVGAEQADLGQQADLALNALMQEGGEAGQEWVRDCAGVEIRHFFRRVQKNNTNYYWCRWSTPLPQPPRIGLQIVEKGRNGKPSVLENRSYEWRQLFPQQVPLADPELEQRFTVYGNDPALVRTALGANGVKAALLGCKQVDLSVDAEGVVFSDPFRENILAALGGGTGMLMVGYDPQAMMRMIAPVHERVSWLAATLARTCA